VLAIDGARAADLPAYKAPPPPVYSWSRFYLGASVWGASTYDAVLTGIGSTSRSEKMDGVTGGFQSGYNQQFGAWVLGFESDIQFSGQKGGPTFSGVFAPTTVTTDESSTGSGRRGPARDS
jgi:outer membrane immunogenic protein